MIPFAIRRDEQAVQNRTGAHCRLCGEPPANGVDWRAAGFIGGMPGQTATADTVVEPNIERYRTLSGHEGRD